VEARYERSLALLPEAIRFANRAYLFDNSGKAHRLIAEFAEGQLAAVSASPSAWFVRNWLNKQPPAEGTISSDN
jgi:predicted ABC-type ATPase